MEQGEKSGGCLCGNVRYTVRGEPVRVGLCHCETCQKNTGSPFLAFAVFPSDAVSMSGSLESHRAPVIDRRFCTGCGTLICLEQEGSGEVDLTLGTFDFPPPYSPEYELWVVNRASWLPAITGARQFEHHRDGKPLP